MMDKRKIGAKEDETKENMSKQETADESSRGAFRALHLTLSRHKIDIVKPA